MPAPKDPACPLRSKLPWRQGGLHGPVGVRTSVDDAGRPDHSDVPSRTASWGCLAETGGSATYNGQLLLLSGLRSRQSGRISLCFLRTYRSSGSFWARPCKTYDFRLLLVISFFNAAPSSGFSSSNEHKRSSDTDMTAPKFCIRQFSTGLIVMGFERNVRRILRNSCLVSLQPVQR